MRKSYVNVAPVNQLHAYVSNMRADQPIDLVFRSGCHHNMTAYEIYRDPLSKVLVVTDSYAVGSYIRIDVE